MEEYEYVVNNSEYVSIDKNKIDDFVNDLKDIKYIHWSKNLNLKLDEQKWILLSFILESMNFCFWKKPKWKIEYNGEIMSGVNALFYTVIKEVENNPQFLNIEYLYNINKEQFNKIFIGIDSEIPMLEERYNNFMEVINFIYNNKNFYSDLFSIKKDVDLLKYIVTNFKSFDDKSNYKNKIIHFNKRANLLVNDLYYLSNTIRKNLNNIDNIKGCADYGIPRTFRDYGILKYSRELENIIDNEKELEHDSYMEIEIRSNMLYVIELIKEKLKEKGIVINSIELDNIIWNIGKNIKKTKVHHTITIYY